MIYRSSILNFSQKFLMRTPLPHLDSPAHLFADPSNRSTEQIPAA